MNRRYQILFLVIFSAVIFAAVASRLFLQTSKQNPVENASTQPTLAQTVTPMPVEISVPDTYNVDGGTYSSQTFNNCGPASLSMALSQRGINVSQAELAERLRPFNNPQGGVDDKAVLAYELVAEAKARGLESMERPNGTAEVLQKLIANDVSVIVRTWLNPNEDIGHYRVLTGYDKTADVFYFNDSYQGPNISLSEDELMKMWEPFNYGYVLIYPKEKDAVVRQILGNDYTVQSAWEKALANANSKLKTEPENYYGGFNKAVALFYLGNYKDSVNEYEKVASLLPQRMLWYQLEPIYAYQKTGEFEKAISIIDGILANGNQAYSELYQIKGEIYLAQNEKKQARQEFEKALFYNKNFNPAKESLANL